MEASSRPTSPHRHGHDHGHDDAHDQDHVPHGPHLQQTSVLANAYVPERLRAINYLCVTTPIHVSPPSTIDHILKTISRASVPRCPCVCKQKHEVFTSMHIMPTELRFALFQPTPILPPVILPLVSNIGSLQDYVQTFSQLLKLEQQELLILYERYSQYQHTLDSTSPPNFSENFASWKIPGIADAGPSIAPGDVCLIRPMVPLSLPMLPPTKRSLKGKPKSKLVWSAPIHFLEIQTTVVSVQRGGLAAAGGTPDTVTTTWVDKTTQADLKKASPTHQYNVRFVPSSKHYSRCQTALGWCASLPPAMAMHLLFPNTAPVLPTSQTAVHLDDFLGNDSLNLAQRQFVDMVLRRSQHTPKNNNNINEDHHIRPPMILTGPAGTGKTKALLQSIHKVLEMNSSTRILVCTPSHTAANVITQRLGTGLSMNTATGCNASNDLLFRLLDSDRPVATIPADILRYCRQEASTGTFTLPENMLQFRVIVCTCSDAHLLYCAGITNAILRDRRQCFSTWLDSVLHQTQMVSNLQGADEPHFTHLFVDEASQATEPELLIPLSVVVDSESVRPAEIALVGDPRQLSPQVYSPIANQCGLGHAWMERLLQRPIPALGGGHAHLLGPNLRTVEDLVYESFQTNLTVFLTMNYRGHPSFLMMPSSLFYFDKLRTWKGIREEKDNGWSHSNLRETIEGLAEPVIGDALKSTLPPLFRHAKKQVWPIHFRGVHGHDKSVTVQSVCGTNSWFNPEEAQAVVDIVVSLCQSDHVSTRSIGVMAPFRGQVVLIRQMLRNQNLSNINVGTIEDYQSVEREIIVLSLTRSSPAFLARDVESRAGVFGQPKRTNVALTRAENVFIVVGNPTIMVDDPIWRQWLWFCLRNGFWYGEGNKVVQDYFAAHREMEIVRHLQPFSTKEQGFLVNYVQDETKTSNDQDTSHSIAPVVFSTLEELCIDDN
jgi:riboflavin biosynthesis pyrimidine reductase